MLTDLLSALGRGEEVGEIPPPEVIAAELERMSAKERAAMFKLVDLPFRARARASMAAYIDYMELGFRPAAHHRLLIKELEAVARKENDRLMVLMPPGSAKSTYTSVVMPPWYLGKFPENSVIAASHTQDLIERFGRRARNLYASPLHKAVFGVSVAKDSGAAARWDTEKKGEYFAVGIGGAVAGRRADLGLIDDPVRSREDADSERVREKTWDWYVNDYLTRLKPGAAQILVMTRWHEDDLGGRILNMEGDRWRVIKLPMQAGVDDPLGRKPFERLWPEWFTEEMMMDAKRDTRAWNALYQQEPASEDGDYFKREWLRETEILPEKLAIYGASDYAVSEGRGDFTEHGIFGVDAWSNVYVLDWWRDQAAADIWVEAQLDLVIRHQPLCWFGEAGVIRNAVEPFLARRMEERRAFCRLEWLPSVHDKPTRCRPFQALASSGKVFFPPNSGWKSDVIGQLCRFPAGMHDDAVDVCSLIGRGLEHVRPPRMVEADLPTHANVGHANVKRRQGSIAQRQQRASLGYARQAEVIRAPSPGSSVLRHLR